MKFPWHKYEEIPLERRNTLQIFVTNDCNLKCEGCFARNIMGCNKEHISQKEYSSVINKFLNKGGKQVNLLGGEPLLHPDISKFIKINNNLGVKTTIYTNGYFLNNFSETELAGAKMRVSIYCKSGKTKSTENLPKTSIPFDVCYMVSRKTDLEEMLGSADIIEKNHNCSTFFISSIRELDNPRKEFFDDTEISMPILDYKELVHKFLEKYEGKMKIHISKRGVFESTKTLPDTKCRFANYFIGGKIIQCPYDIVNQKFQEDYEFGTRNCQQNSTCLMSKIILKRK